MLLSSNVIHIYVRVVMLVCMTRTRFFATARVKSCPGMHSSCVIASLSGCARTVGRPPISGGSPGTDKRKLLAQYLGAQVSVKHLRAEDLKLSLGTDVEPSESEDA